MMSTMELITMGYAKSLGLLFSHSFFHSLFVYFFINSILNHYCITLNFRQVSLLRYLASIQQGQQTIVDI